MTKSGINASSGVSWPVWICPNDEPEFQRIERGRRAAVCLKEILDRIPVPPDEEIPGGGDVDPTGDEPVLKQWWIPHTNIIFLIGLMIVIVGAGSRIAEVLVASPKINTKGLDAQLTRIVCRIVALGAATIVFLEGGKYLGIPISTLLASAGVGGLALALAAQDSLKNFFGSMMIILDKPFRVGERIVVGDFDGIVEEIGLRSTKIRLLTGHQATVPNEEMARTHVENIGRRPHIRRLADLRLPLDTPSDKAREAVAIVEGILADHEGMEPGLEPKTYLTDICPDALNLRMVYWFHPPDYWDFLAFGQKVNLEIKQSFERAGIEFALPTTTTHVRVDGEDRP